MKQKTAFISIVGKANVGKSSLLNSLIGQKISIVSKKAQTTRTKINGILTENETQLIFVDTPGMHKQKNKLSKYMIESINTGIKGVDFAMLVVEAGTKISEAEIQLIKRFETLHLPAILVINKIDKLKDKKELLSQIAELCDIFDFISYIPVSAKTAEGLNKLKDELSSLAKEGPFLFEEDSITDQAERTIASELIREKALRLLGQEVPHGIAVVIEKMKERTDKDILDIDANIFCERPGHKAIIIGKSGTTIKNIGIKAREELESFFDCRVNLSLWVKVRENWRNNNTLLTNFGFDKKDLKI